ncbi:hypothetical protein Bbelb_078110 [Branchiostoma belcheri]|nr:hypothetical protein Bbelb_078110 [Branchiostoma belcheri]
MAKRSHVLNKPKAPGRDSISLEPFTEDSTWKIKKTQARRQVMQYECCPEGYVHVDFSITLQRSPSALLQFNLIAPTVLFLAAAVLGFYLPSDTGSRTLLGVVSLLGVTLVSLLNYGNFPLGSNATTPIIGQFYALAVILVGLFTVVTIGLWGIHHHAADMSPVPGWLKAVLSGLARVCCIRYPAADTGKDGAPLGSAVSATRHRPPTKTELHWVADTGKDWAPLGCRHRQGRGSSGVCCIRYPAADTGKDGAPLAAATDKDGAPLGSIATGDGPAEGGAASTVTEIKKLKCMQDILQNVHAIAQTVDEQSKNTANQRDWQNVALVIDRVLLTAFILTALIGTLAILLQLA